MDQNARKVEMNRVMIRKSAGSSSREPRVATTALPGEVADSAPPTDTPPKYRQERLQGRRLPLKGKEEDAAAEGEEG